MNFTKLKYVVAVDRAQSVSVAAKTLNISQSAVTKAVADIETELGLTLFDRRARGVDTTPDGRAFIDRAARILSDVETLGADMTAARQKREALLRVAVTPASLEGLMNRAVLDVIASDPDLRLHLFAMPLDVSLQQLRQGDVDAVVGPRRVLDEDPRTVCTPLPDLKPLLYVRKGHPLTARAGLSVDDITRYPIVAPDTQNPIVPPLLEVLASLGGDPMRRLHIIGSYQIASRLVETGDAIGIVQDNFARTQGFNRRFVALNFKLGTPIPMAVAVQKSLRNTAVMRRLVSALIRFPPTG